jgi:hypothetical protein
VELEELLDAVPIWEGGIGSATASVTVGPRATSIAAGPTVRFDSVTAPVTVVVDEEILREFAEIGSIEGAAIQLGDLELPAQIPPGGTIALPVSYEPSAVNANAELQIGSNAVAEPIRTLELMGSPALDEQVGVTATATALATGQLKLREDSFSLELNAARELEFLSARLGGTEESVAEISFYPHLDVSTAPSFRARSTDAVPWPIRVVQ